MRIGSVVEFNPYFGAAKHVLHPLHVEERMDLLIFWGGADIDPALYHEKNVASYSDPDRDAIEVPIFLRALELKIPMLGICRGAQFLCAMNGGKLWQNVKNHGRSHMVTTSSNTEFVVTSTHHQMMRPFGGELLAWAKDILSLEKENADGKTLCSEPEAEVVYWKDTNSLGVQGHPEYLDKDSPFSQYVRSLIKDKLNVNLA